jgi:nucleoside permease NupC
VLLSIVVAPEKLAMCNLSISILNFYDRDIKFIFKSLFLTRRSFCFALEVILKTLTLSPLVDGTTIADVMNTVKHRSYIVCLSRKKQQFGTPHLSTSLTVQ